MSVHLKKQLLSFQDDEDLEDLPTHSQIKSSHDLLNDPKLSKQKAVTQVSEIQSQIDRDHEKAKNGLKQTVRRVNHELEEDDPELDKEIKRQILEQHKARSMEAMNKVIIEPVNMGSFTVETDSATNRLKVTTHERSLDDELGQLESDLLLTYKKNPTGTNNPEVRQEVQNEEKLLSPLELRRYKFYQYKKKTKGREDDTLSKLNSFLSHIKSHKKPPETQTEEDKTYWFNNRLKFSIDSSRAYAFDKMGDNKINEENSQGNKKLKRYEDEDLYAHPELQDLLNLDNLYKITQNKET